MDDILLIEGQSKSKFKIKWRSIVCLELHLLEEEQEVYQEDGGWDFDKIFDTMLEEFDDITSSYYPMKVDIKEGIKNIY